MNPLKTYIIFLFLFIPLPLYAQYVSDFRVNDDTGSAHQSSASLDVDREGNFIVVWRDERKNFNKIFLQKYSKLGIKLGNNVNVDISPDIAATSPSIKFRSDGSFVLLWYGGNGISHASYKMKFFNQNGLPVNQAIIVNDTVPVLASIAPARIGLDKSNNIFIVLSYGLGDVKKLYLQKFDSIGNRIGTNQPISDNFTSSEQERADITVRNDDSFIVTWQEHIFGPLNIFFQMYDPDGNKVGMNRRVNDFVHNEVNFQMPSISSDSTGRFIIAWIDSRLTLGSYDNIFAQIYNHEGIEIGSNFRVDQGALPYNRWWPKTSMRKDGNTVIGWHDQIAGPTMRRFSPAGSFIGGEFHISYQPVQNSRNFQDITIWEDRVITVWQDYRINNYDIYCNIRSFQNPDSVVNSISQVGNEIPGRFELYQNYPNPFNPVTNLGFGISKIGFASLKVFDIQGREVKTLINKDLSPGSYEVEFDGSRFPSGIYFYTLDAGDFKQTRRMALIK